MADEYRRMRQIIGTTAEWGVSDIVIGAGEIALERQATGKVMAKIGDGSTRFSGLPYFSSLDQSAADGRYVLISDLRPLGGAASANKVPQLNGQGKLDNSMLLLPPTIIYRGTTPAVTQGPPPGAGVGDLWVNTETGNVNAAYLAPAAGQHVNPGDMMTWNGLNWGIIPQGTDISGSIARDGTRPPIAETSWNNQRLTNVLDLDVNNAIYLSKWNKNDQGTQEIHFWCADDLTIQSRAALVLGATVGVGGSDGYLDFVTSHYGVNRDVRMRIDRDGNVGFGTTNIPPGTSSRQFISGDLSLIAPGVNNMVFNGYYSGGAWRAYQTGTVAAISFNNSDGSIQFFGSGLGGTPGASIALTEQFRVLTNGYVTARGYNFGTLDARAGILANNNPGVQFDTNDYMDFTQASNTWKLTIGSVVQFIVDTSQFYPGVDNNLNLGFSTNRWKTVFAVTGTISTSDEREKTWRGAATADELEAARRIVAELGFYQWNDALEEKEGDARYHYGIRAQRVWAIMAELGLVAPIGADGKPGACPYGFLCFDQWDKATEEVIETDPETGESRPTGDVLVIREAGSRFGVRYDELLLFLVSAQEARLAALEQQWKGATP